MAERFLGPKQDPRTPATRAFSRSLFSWLQALVFSLILLVLLFTFFGRVIAVEGHSMDPTLQDGELLLLQSLGYRPAAGDIVVLTKPFASVRGPIVKRIIATGGQRIEIDYAESRVYVDGLPLDEPYLNGVMVAPSDPNEQNLSLVVPEGELFVMGDNRNHSSDSRNVLLGTVDERYVLGRAFFILLPFDQLGRIPYN